MFIMESAFPNTNMDAFLTLAFDIPPIAHLPVDPISDGAITTGHQTWPVVNMSATPHPVIGVTTSGWVMIDGIGWQRLQGDVAKIAAACNVMQSRLLEDRAAYMAAMDRYPKRSDTGIVGGLPEIDVVHERCAIRLDDITAPHVKEAFFKAIRGKDSGFAVDSMGPNTFTEAGCDYVEANVWWQFAWRWKTST
jgi:hypothetical protein